MVRNAAAEISWPSQRMAKPRINQSRHFSHFIHFSFIKSRAGLRAVKEVQPCRTFLRPSRSHLRWQHGGKTNYYQGCSCYGNQSIYKVCASDWICTFFLLNKVKGVYIHIHSQRRAKEKEKERWKIECYCYIKEWNIGQKVDSYSYICKHIHTHSCT